MFSCLINCICRTGIPLNRSMYKFSNSLCSCAKIISNFIDLKRLQKEVNLGCRRFSCNQQLRRLRSIPGAVDEIKQVLVLYTGGAIGMKKDANGVLKPVANVMIDKIVNDPEINCGEISELMELPGLTHNARILYKIREYQPLLDSSDLTPDNWTKIAEDIGEEYANWDGFVLLLGTDTLAYTASALSFMLEGLHKPVILTGALVPIFEVGTDAKTNFLSAIKFAATEHIKEVCVCFANKLLRGNRSTQISSEAIESFISPNYHRLGEVGGVGFKVHNQFLWTGQLGYQNFIFNLSKNVVILQIFPTMKTELLNFILSPPTQGVVLLCYGVGNIPNKLEYKRALREAVERGVIIVNLTQCVTGTVSLSYEGGELLEDVGTLSGYDMTVEAAFTKLSYVLALPINHGEKVTLMTTNICGELTK